MITSGFFRERSVPFLSKNGKLITQFILTFFFIGVGIWFVKHGQSEILQIRNNLGNVSLLWILIGLSITMFYILLQGLLYVVSFASIGAKVSVTDAVVLFLKRNFISAFIPAGGFSSLLFFGDTIRKKGNSKSQIHLASSVYAFIGILSVIIVAVPVFIYAVMEGRGDPSDWYALAVIVLFLLFLILFFRSILRKSIVFRIWIKWFPKTEVFLNDLTNHTIDKKKFLLAVSCSLLIDIVGVAHLYVAMIALHFEPSLLTASVGYIVSVIFLIISPFMRGLGAIEVSMSYVLIRYGFNNVEAVSITFLYRFFEFWMPLFAGMVTFLSKSNKIVMRIVPALLLFCLGIVNIVSVVTPAITIRLMALRNFLPMEAIHASNYLVFAAGLFLLVTSSFMLRGLRAAWWFALVLSMISLIGHITKAIDFEEATIALVIILILLVTRNEYYIKTNPKLRLIGIQTSVLSVVAVIVYGIIGFYFLDKKHFNIDFSWLQSIRYTLQNFFLVGSNELVPLDGFANHFLASIKISGFISLGFLIYALIKPYVFKNVVTSEEIEIANQLVEKYGTSSMDYFKTYFDKLIFISPGKNAFISYRITRNYAVVLGNPVAADTQEMKQCIKEFDDFCRKSGLKSIFYRVPEDDLEIYKKLNKKFFFLGQEGIVDLANFNLEGNSKKSLRNALNKISESGLKVSINHPPIKDGVLQKIEAVSNDWLANTKRSEIVFSQGIFLWDELKNQTVITVENKEEKIIAFLNIIPDYAKGEATYDLIRKTNDAPSGVIDFILVALFNYLKSQNYVAVNLGLAPMAGIENPQTIPEKSIKFVYEKVKSFSRYKGLHDFKEKFSPVWHNQYIIFSDDYDLIQIPRILAKVIKP